MNKNRRILIIDDNPAIHEDFKNILLPRQAHAKKLETMEEALFGEKVAKGPMTDFEVDCASQGQEGYAMVLRALKAGRPYATAFMDVRMPPGWDGIETAERIWADCPDLQIVICTAYSDYSWDNIREKLGHSDQLLILKKPFENIEVMQIALALTEKWHLTREARMRIEEVEKKVLERTRELQEFAYGVSHDLQEPLRKVTTFGERLHDKCIAQLGEDGLDYLGRMQDAARRMQVLISDLLELSRVTTRARPFVRVNLKTIVSGVLSDLEVRIEQVGGKVEVGSLPTLESDPTQMRQLFQNLIGNALKFRKKDVSPLIQIHAEPAPAEQTGNDEKGRARWLIKVQDNGIGFEEKYADRIFEVFQRLHTRTEYEGSGIGLSLVRRIVERHDGSICAKGIPGSGATFLITLPEKHASPKQAEPAPAIAQTETASTSDMPEPSILAAEHDAAPVAAVG